MKGNQKRILLAYTKLTEHIIRHIFVVDMAAGLVFDQQQFSIK
jgi:hypothetical protein